ncbi:MAG: DUF4870 family protein [Hyphomonadaceae bacterium]
MEPGPTPAPQGVNETLTGGNKSNAQLIYILYLLSLVVGITSIVGVIMAYVSKDAAPEWLKTHYIFQIRTFWVGLLFAFIGGMLTLVLIGFLILLFVLVWWIVRCVQGLNYLGKDQAIPNYRSWMFV